MNDRDQLAEQIAIAMRQAYHDATSKAPLVPWEEAKPKPKNAWMICAYAALDVMKPEKENERIS